MTTPFWSNDPTILFNKSSMFQVWPSSSMTVEAKMNAMTGIQADTVLQFNCYTSHNVSYKRKVKVNAMAMIQADAVPQIATSHKCVSVKFVNVSVHQGCVGLARGCGASDAAG